MIVITKEEKELISSQLPNVHIVRTMKQKSKRHQYYCEETKQVAQLLNQMRGERTLASINSGRRDFY